MGNRNSSSSPPPLTQFEELRRDLLDRLPVSVHHSYRSNYVSGWQHQSEEEEGDENDAVASNSSSCFSSPSKKKRAGVDSPPLWNAPIEFEYGESAAFFTPQNSIDAPTATNQSEPREKLRNNNSQISSPRKKRQFRSLRIPVYGVVSNHLEFLDPRVLDVLLPYLLGPALSNVLAVCPHWFLSIYQHLLRRVGPIVKAFQKEYSGKLELREATFSTQKLAIKGGFPRVDLLLYAKVNPACINRCITIGYTYSYSSPSSLLFPSSHLPAAFQVNLQPPEDDSSDSHALVELSHKRGGSGVERSLYAAVLSPPLGMLSDGRVMFPRGSSYGGSRDVKHTTATSSWLKGTQPQYVYEGSFRFNCQRRGIRRELLMHKDITRFHGDELLVGRVPSVAVVCAEDIVEIPVVVANAFGLADLSSIRWSSMTVLPTSNSGAQRDQGVDICTLDSQNFVWMDIDAYQQTTPERIAECDFFGPQLRHQQSLFTGIDITISKSKYVAAKTGEVPQSQKMLGVRFVVLDSQKPIICPLKRFGLQHDRYTPQQLRLGDSLVLYMSQGGSVGDGVC